MMAQDWYVEEENGSVAGPFAEKEVAARLLAGEIKDNQRVRQGDQTEWCSAQRARIIFQRLAETGWYIKEDDQVYGPFTDAKILDLYRADDISDGAFLRQGPNGDWKTASSLLSQWVQQSVQKPTEDSSTTVGKWSVAPFRHVFMKLEQGSTGKCQPLEHVSLREHNESILVERACGQSVGQLSNEDALQIRFNSERGVTHLSFVITNRGPNCIAVVLCPPGSSASMCHQYLNEHFRAPEIIPQTESDTDRFDPHAPRM